MIVIARARLHPVLIAAVAGVALAACSGGPPPAFERPPAAVTVAEAVQQDVPHYLDAIGKVTAREVVSIQPQVSGRITAIRFTDGADLKKGAPLFLIDPRPYQAQLDAATGNKAQAEAALALARLQVARGEQLIQTKAISQQEYDIRKNALEVAEAQVQQTRAAVENAQLNLDYCAIHSPIEGRAGKRLVDVGNVVTANEGSLLTIQRLDPIYADFTVTENDLTEVQRSMKSGALEVEAQLPDQDAAHKGTLTFLDNAVQEGTGNVTLRATIPNADHQLWPGRFVRIRLILATLPGAVLVPATAPQMSARGPFVYVVKSDATAEMRPVKTGQRHGDLVVIDDGVQAGEKVVVNGQLGVTPGGKVREEPGATASGAEDKAKSGGSSSSNLKGES